MAPSKRQKIDRESNAAYAASQPLFDALRNGASKVDEQRIHLLKARDTVQQLHVKLVDVNGSDDAEKHEQYMDATVKAWRSATEAFSSIFEELCKISAPDASEGREAGEHHEQFKHLAETAAAAQKAAVSYEPSTKKTTPAKPGKRVRKDEGAEKAGEATAHQAKKVRIVAPPAEQTATRAQKRPSAPLEEETAEVDGAERPAKLLKRSDEVAGTPKQGHALNKSARRREVRKQKKRESAAASETTQGQAASAPTVAGVEVSLDRGQEPSPASAGKENKVPNVEYEDVSAEVAARLKAKEAKKQAKKEEKKRKRESGDSALADAHMAPEKSSKKKANVDGVAVAVNPATKEKVVKRKVDGQGAEETGAGGAAKKRKKAKA